MKHPNDIRRKNSGGLSLGQFFRSRSRMTHKSCDVAMLPHPDPMQPSLPWIERPGHTYNVGRNKAKRECRAAGV